MKGLAVDPNIIADDAVLDVIFAANFGDEVGILCESVSRAVCRALLLASDRTGYPVDMLFNTSLDLKMRFKMPTADEFASGDAFCEEEED